jgi:hypothetical protein
MWNSLGGGGGRKNIEQMGLQSAPQFIPIIKYLEQLPIFIINSWNSIDIYMMEKINHSYTHTKLFPCVAVEHNSFEILVFVCEIVYVMASALILHSIHRTADSTIDHTTSNGTVCGQRSLESSCSMTWNFDVVCYFINSLIWQSVYCWDNENGS